MISAARIQSTSSMETWRQYPFELSGHYMAIQSFDGCLDSSFETGQMYVLDRVEYSDEHLSTIVIFHKRGSSVPVCWWWYDDEPASLCQERFCRLPGSTRL